MNSSDTHHTNEINPREIASDLFPYDWLLIGIWGAGYIAENYFHNNYTVTENFRFIVITIYFVTNTIICLFDTSQIKSFGLKPPCFGWVIIFIPIYLWKRAKLLKTKGITFYLSILILALPFWPLLTTIDYNQILSPKLDDSEVISTVKTIIFENIDPNNSLEEIFRRNSKTHLPARWSAYTTKSGALFVQVEFEEKNTDSIQVFEFEVRQEKLMVYAELKKYKEFRDGKWYAQEAYIGLLKLKKLSSEPLTESEKSILKLMKMTQQ